MLQAEWRISMITRYLISSITASAFGGLPRMMWMNPWTDIYYYLETVLQIFYDKDGCEPLWLKLQGLISQQCREISRQELWLETIQVSSTKISLQLRVLETEQFLGCRVMLQELVYYTLYNVKLAIRILSNLMFVVMRKFTESWD